MTKEVISRTLRVKYHSGGLNPIDVNEHFLESVGIIDDNNKLNRSLLRVGSIGTNIIFANESEDEIKVGTTALEIESRYFDRLTFILNTLKSKFGVVALQFAEYRFDTHLIDESYPDKIFQKYINSNDLKLDIIQFKKDKFVFTMYNCGINKIHIIANAHSSISKQFSDFDLEKDLQIEHLEQAYNNFILKELEIKQ